MKAFALTLVTLISSSAFAANITVFSRAYSETECNYYYASLADYQVNYTNAALPWGTSVKLVYGFHDSWTKRSWQNPRTKEMTSTAPYTWSIDLKGLTVDSRGSFSMDQFQFVFEVNEPSTSWVDYAGIPGGTYSTEIPKRLCKPEEFQALTVSAGVPSP